MTLMKLEEDSENEASSSSFLAIPLPQDQALASFDMLPGAQEGKASSLRDDATTTTTTSGRSSVGLLPSPTPFLRHESTTSTSSSSRRVQELVDVIADCIRSMDRAAGKSVVPTTPTAAYYYSSPRSGTRRQLLVENSFASPALLAVQQLMSPSSDSSDGRPTLPRGTALRFDTMARLQTTLS
jgi:hypothetical protein